MATIHKNVIISTETIALKSNLAIDAPTQPDVIAEPDTTAISEQAYAQGFSDGVATEKSRIVKKETNLDTLLHSIPKAINDNRLLLTTEIADIVLMVAQQLFINQQQNKDSIVHQVTNIIAQLNDKHNIEVALHPDDMTRNDFNIDAKHYKNLRFVADETLRLGGCIVRSEHGVFDAGIERQIDNLKHVLLQMKQGDVSE